MNNVSRRWRVLLAFAVVYLVWGSTYLGIRYAIATIPPLLMAGTRFLTAGTLLFAWSQWKGYGRPKAIHWRSAAILGILMLLCGNGGVTLAERQIPSGLAALLVATEPLWLVVLAWIKPTGTAPTLRQVVGLIAGFGGVSILVGGGALPANSGQIEALGIPALLVLGAALCWAAGSIYATDAPAAPATVSNGIVMMCGGVFLLFSGLLHGEAAQLRLQSISGLSILALVYLTVAGSLAAFSAYTYLLSSTTPAMASTYAFVNPVVAVLLGWSFAGEPITSRSLLAMCTIVAAVILLTVKKREPKEQDQLSCDEPIAAGSSTR